MTMFATHYQYHHSPSLMAKTCGAATRAAHVVPVDYGAEVSQRLVDACHRGDARAASECLADLCVDVNYAGAVCLRVLRAELVPREEAPYEVRIEYEELQTDASPLFLAAHAGNADLVRKLLNSGADINMKLFKGFATTAAVREGRVEILELLLKSGASQLACEEALLEACHLGKPKLVELLMQSDFIRPQIAVHALVSACTRGFVDVASSLIKCGVDANSTDRLLLQSLKPSLHTNADCTALIAAIVTRQVSVVRHLLQVGVKRDLLVRLGAWSWDTATGEELRVGVGLAEPYNATWCAVEYFESSGTILRMLLHHHQPNALHHGRALIHHAILCDNSRAVDELLNYGADCELPVKTNCQLEFRPIHLAARLGSLSVLKSLIKAGCDYNSRTHSGETALMFCARYKQDACLKALAIAGADLGLLNRSGASAESVAISNQWATGFQRSLLDVLRSGHVLRSTNSSVFSALIFAARLGEVEALEAVLRQPETNINQQDENGYTALMFAAKEGQVDTFRCLVYAGADVKLCNNAGKTALMISLTSSKHDLFEKVMLEYALEKGTAGGFYALNYAARRGDLAAVRILISRGHDVNIADKDDYTPLMLAAKEGHGKLCDLLISYGAFCDAKTSRGETALSLARMHGGPKNEAEQVILNALSRMLVLSGGKVRKHTKRGKGRPHGKILRMVCGAGVLRWGRSSRRNVICKEAEVGPSSTFSRNRRGKGDAFNAGVFRIVTTKGKEVHFVCEGGDEAAELWVRGIMLITNEAFM